MISATPAVLHTQPINAINLASLKWLSKWKNNVLFRVVFSFCVHVRFFVHFLSLSLYSLHSSYFIIQDFLFTLNFCVCVCVYIPFSSNRRFFYQLPEPVSLNHMHVSKKSSRLLSFSLSFFLFFFCQHTKFELAINILFTSTKKRRENNLNCMDKNSEAKNASCTQRHF